VGEFIPYGEIFGLTLMSGLLLRAWKRMLENSAPKNFVDSGKTTSAKFQDIFSHQRQVLRQTWVSSYSGRP
jgi:hypothetical protein